MKRTCEILMVLILATSFKLPGNDYPIPPKTRELMFYIQRNHNSNTVVYEANFDDIGQLVKDEPLKVEWIRYDEEGQRKELTYIQGWYAYGVKWKKQKDKENNYVVELVAHKDRKLWLEQNGPFKAKVYTFINNQYSELDHLYIQADNSGVWPKVEYIELFGNDTKTGSNTYEKYYNQ